MRIIALIVPFLFINASAHAARGACTYEFEPSSVQVSWTAFKTTEKLAVSGVVKELQVRSTKKASSLQSLLENTVGSGKFDSEKKSDSGNPGRDMTVFQKFFALFKRSGEFNGSFVRMNGSDTQGKVGLKMSVNSKQKLVPMDYQISSDGQFVATGSFDMLEVGLQEAHSSIHAACEELHKGKDGVSKTWTDVGLKISAKLIKECL